MVRIVWERGGGGGGRGQNVGRKRVQSGTWLCPSDMGTIIHYLDHHCHIFYLFPDCPSNCDACDTTTDVCLDNRCTASTHVQIPDTRTCLGKTYVIHVLLCTY